MQEFTEQEVQVLYEMRAILNVVNKSNATLKRLIEITSPQGSLYTSQEKAIRSLDHWKSLFGISQENDETTTLTITTTQ